MTRQTRQLLNLGESQTPTKIQKLYLWEKLLKSQETKLNTKLFFLISRSPSGAQVRSRPILVANETQLIHLCDRFSEFSDSSEAEKGRKINERNYNNYSFAVRGASTRAGIAAGEGKLKQAEVIMWMVIGWD